MKKLLLLALIISVTLSAQSRPTTTTGEIDLAQDEKKVSRLDVTAAEGSAVIKALLDKASSYQGGEMSKISTSDKPNMQGKIPTNLLQYLSIMYLNCIIEKGTCPELLDSILEFDVINSKIDNKVSCPNMLLFWKAWLDNDMEKRHQHHSKITQVQKIDEFNRTKRKNYTKCKDTITALIEADKNTSNEEFFKKRMALAAVFAKSASDYLISSQEKAADIYAELEFKQ